MQQEDFIVETILGIFIIEDFGDAEYDVATNMLDSNFYYHIPKGLSEVEVKNYFEELKSIEE